MQAAVRRQHMKLYISSYKLGSKTNVLKKWIKDYNNRIMMITSARDGYPDNERKTKGIQTDMMALQELGFDVAQLSLRDYFQNPDRLREDLKSYHAFSAIGGNTFILRQAMLLSGFDEFLRDNVYQDSFLYGGYSAGICLLAPSLKGLELVDDSDADPYHYPVIYNGLDLIDYLPVPHYRSDHPETHLVEDVIGYLMRNNIKYKTLHDGDVIIEDLHERL
jgi:dipeptidase E